MKVKKNLKLYKDSLREKKLEKLAKQLKLNIQKRKKKKNTL
tara:strand:- start:5652 stop:5774 length:123 start_codon:yes stop_codon:yes gene_type:complete